MTHAAPILHVVHSVPMHWREGREGDGQFMITDDHPIDLEVYRRVAERHCLVFERVQGSFTDAARYLMTQWDTARSSVNKLLKSPGEVFWEGDYWGVASRKLTFESHGIMCRHEVTRASPWARCSDQRLVELVFKRGWSRLGPRRRIQWLHNVRAAFFKQRDHFQTLDRTGLVIHLKGPEIVDDAAFYLAMGEAVHGPGGYLGACTHSFLDCFCGGFGVALPLTLYWPGRDPQGFEDLIGMLRKAGVELRE